MNKILYIFLIFCLSCVSPFLKGKEKPGRSKLFEKTEVSTSKTNAKSIAQEEKDNVSNNILSEFKTYTIGKDALKGTITVEDSIAEIVASGKDIWGTEDEGYFIFKQIKGDFEVSVRFHNLSPSDLYTKAGIMARNDLSDNAKHVYFLVFPDNQERNNNNGGCEFQYRAKRGGESKAIYPDQQTAGETFNVNFPETWIKLKREKNTFSAFISSNAENWYQYSSYEQKMPRKLLIGLAATSHNPQGYTRAEFSELHIKTY
ncbi:DUF1349 domain-containing protein [Maribellus comscasis]|uniref:DUF1349 domain-containing protein n=1 Tax=Maribellus comscasis TaxID=2681766 RepID=A0A6I6JWE8_9BACT|nr:DUF1349 domain-containing protein [Maribellus comscasis]QGY47456.1 DUF1349 domain-containing protein [Maribellus comscasis]